MKNQKKFPKLIKDNVYEIEWVDAFGFSGWFTQEEIDGKAEKPATNLTVGFFIKEENGFIILAMTRETGRDDFAPYGTPKFIPRGYIKTIRAM